MPSSAACQTIPSPRKSGWTPERRARQAARIRLWAPWARSTGPKTLMGKAKSSKNSYKHGCRARDMRLMSKALSAQSRYVRAINAYIFLKNCHTSFRANELIERRLYLQGIAASAMLRYALYVGGWVDVDQKLPRK